LSRFSEMETIYDTLRDNTTLALSRIAFDRMGGPKFVPPTIDPDTPEDSIFIRPMARTQAGTERSFWANDNAVYREGILTIEAWGPVGTGWDQTATILETHLLIFSKQDISNVHFGVASGLDPRGDVTAPGAWEQVNGYVGYSVFEQESSEVPVASSIVEITLAGLSENDFVALNDSNDTWEKGIADTSAHVYSRWGFVLDVNGSTAQVATEGNPRRTAHGLGTGRLYVSQSTAGSVSTTKPTSGVFWNPAVGLNANRLAVLGNAPIQL